jgi:hypothetical protein
LRHLAEDELENERDLLSNLASAFYWQHRYRKTRDALITASVIAGIAWATLICLAVYTWMAGGGQ